MSLGKHGRKERSLQRCRPDYEESRRDSPLQRCHLQYQSSRPRASNSCSERPFTVNLAPTTILAFLYFWVFKIKDLWLQLANPREEWIEAPIRGAALPCRAASSPETEISSPPVPSIICFA